MTICDRCGRRLAPNMIHPVKFGCKPAYELCCACAFAIEAMAKAAISGMQAEAAKAVCASPIGDSVVSPGTGDGSQQ